MNFNWAIILSVIALVWLAILSFNINTKNEQIDLLEERVAELEVAVNGQVNEKVPEGQDDEGILDEAEDDFDEAEDRIDKEGEEPREENQPTSHNTTDLAVPTMAQTDVEEVKEAMPIFNFPFFPTESVEAFELNQMVKDNNYQVAFTLQP